jgi:hypothetical protein
MPSASRLNSPPASGHAAARKFFTRVSLVRHASSPNFMDKANVGVKEEKHDDGIENDSWNSEESRDSSIVRKFLNLFHTIEFDDSLSNNCERKRKRLSIRRRISSLSSKKGQQLTIDHKPNNVHCDEHNVEFLGSDQSADREKKTNAVENGGPLATFFPNFKNRVVIGVDGGARNGNRSNIKDDVEHSEANEDNCDDYYCASVITAASAALGTLFLLLPHGDSGGGGGSLRNSDGRGASWQRNSNSKLISFRHDSWLSTESGCCDLSVDRK